jgi:F420-dependent hydroxymycolic acid dehydrogenase
MVPWIAPALLGSRTQQAPRGHTARGVLRTGVTTPTSRHDPATAAQAFATLGQLYPGRVFLGVGTGEALNELAASGELGRYQERHDRLAEAVSLFGNSGYLRGQVVTAASPPVADGASGAGSSS